MLVYCGAKVHAIFSQYRQHKGVWKKGSYKVHLCLFSTY